MPTTSNKNRGSSDEVTGSRDSVPRIRSADLLRGGRRIIIEHADEDYCLRLTRNERLILTKS